MQKKFFALIRPIHECVRGRRRHSCRSDMHETSQNAPETETGALPRDLTRLDDVMSRLSKYIDV